MVVSELSQRADERSGETEWERRMLSRAGCTNRSSSWRRRDGEEISRKRFASPYNMFPVRGGSGK